MPSRRMRRPLASDSTSVRAVPRETPPARPATASRSRIGSSTFAAANIARQSLGTTSKPTPGSSTTPASSASLPRRAIASKTSISPVTSR